MMRDAKLLLEQLTRRFPPGNPHYSHHIALEGTHLAVFMARGGGKYMPIGLTEDDLSKPMGQLVDDICAFVVGD